MEIERDPEMTIEYLTSINEIIMTLPSGLLSPTILERLLSTVQGCLTEYFERLQSREETRLSEDYDAEYEEALADEDDTDEEVSGELSRVIHAVFKNLGPAFLPYFQQMIPRLGDFVVKQRWNRIPHSSNHRYSERIQSLPCNGFYVSSMI